MSDTPVYDDVRRARELQDELHDLMRGIEILSAGHDYPDLRHAITKLSSADRGLDDFIRKGGP